MYISPYALALIGVGSTVIGTLLGSWIGYRLSLQLAAINNRRQANQRLISTFHRELSEIYPYPVKWPNDIVSFLESKFTVLNAAVGEFRHYLPPKEWDAFDNAWFCFYNATGREIDNKNYQCYHHYIAFGSNPNYKENLKKNVDDFLKYAKQI